jgi:hypothetical protein
MLTLPVTGRSPAAERAAPAGESSATIGEAAAPAAGRPRDHHEAATPAASSAAVHPRQHDDLAGDADEWQRRAPVREDTVDPVTVIFWIVVIIARPGGNGA